VSAASSPAGAVLHASALLIGEAGLLIRGASGSGKSALARELIAWAETAGRFGRLVSDDRVRVEARHGRLIARGVAPIAGRIEIRGIGLVNVPYEPAAVIRLVVDLDTAPVRLPAEADLAATWEGVTVPRIVVNAPLAPGVVLLRLGRLRDEFVTVP
jgi:serine kinase of HPr protein (carbohydrate metabolism regulator)